MKDQVLAKALEEMTPDPWRLQVGFSDSLAAAQEELLSLQLIKDAAKKVLNRWLGGHQPCIFGRAAARLGTIHFCILTEEDLEAGDARVRSLIQTERARWKTAAARGESSSFVIAVVADRLARARPDKSVCAFASRLCQLYLLENEVKTDRIYLDSLDLEVPLDGGRRRVLRFDVGVNYFCAQGDQRWWHDHRIPGGMAFSMNSVGHLVKSVTMRESLQSMGKLLLGEGEEDGLGSIDTLPKALIAAMRTIEGAQETVSGKATFLLPLKEEGRGARCPVKPPASLADKDCESYFGYYHTDHTLPGDYFRAEVSRPAEIKGHVLDFSYLFDDRLDNPDYLRVGKGLAVRGVVAAARRRMLEKSERAAVLDVQSKRIKRRRVTGEVVWEGEGENR